MTPLCRAIPQDGISPSLRPCQLPAGHEGDEHEDYLGVRFTLRVRRPGRVVVTGSYVENVARR